MDGLRNIVNNAGALHGINAPSDVVTIHRDDDGMYVVGDEGGEFGRSYGIEQALRYVEDLLYGPSTYWKTEIRRVNPDG